MSWRLALLCSFSVAALVTGCSRSQTGAPPSTTAPQSAPAVEIATVSVDEALSRAKGGRLTWVDANTEQVRESEGIVPNAVLLSSLSGFEERELGPDKDRTYVFYCVNRL